MLRVTYSQVTCGRELRKTSARVKSGASLTVCLKDMMAIGIKIPRGIYFKHRPLKLWIGMLCVFRDVSLRCRVFLSQRFKSPFFLEVKNLMIGSEFKYSINNAVTKAFFLTDWRHHSKLQFHFSNRIILIFYTEFNSLMC